MSGFKEKSSQSSAAADHLIKSALFSSSVHCSYYSCVQNLLHILFNKLNLDQKQFQSDARNNNKGTHKWAADVIGIQIAKKSVKDYKWFQREFGELRALREVADYSEELIGSDSSRDAKRRCSTLNNFLTQTF